MSSKRKGRIKPQGEMTRGSKVTHAPLNIREIESWSIHEWHPDLEAKQPAEQIHLMFHVEGYSAPLVIRFKSPDTIGFMIEELADYRNRVFPDAEPLFAEEVDEDDD